MKIYRAISVRENRDYWKHNLFRTAKNTLEAKQFFKSETGAKEFILESAKMKFSPPYKYLFHIEINEACLSLIKHDEQILDGFKAITIQEAHLSSFNKCVNLVTAYVI